VVVGTVIDPELTNTVRVTVVATGLGRPAAIARPSLSSHHREVAAARESVHARERVESSPMPSMRVVRRQPLTSSDYAALDKPTVQRQRAVGDGLRPEPETEDLLDIPAFLRRQAD
jgi:cell division protein FtsZ